MTDIRINLGEILTKRGLLEEAEAVLRHALSEREQLASRYPDVPDSLANLGLVAISLAESLRDQGKYAEATELTKRAITLHQTALTASPKHPTFLAWLRNGYVLLAEILLSKGDTKNAFEAVETAIRILPDAPDTFSEIACAYTRCVPRLEELPNRNNAQRRELSLSVADRAVGLLRMGIKNGHAWTAKSLQEHPELQSLPPFESFQSLVKELNQK